MRNEQPGSKPAKILYRPWGILTSIIAGLIARQAFEALWKHAGPSDQDTAPKALESEYALKQVLVAAAFQGAVFAIVKASVSRGGARAFQRWTGEWPGD